MRVDGSRGREAVDGNQTRKKHALAQKKHALPPRFSAIRDFWVSGAKPVAIITGAGTGALPYAQLLAYAVVWLAPLSGAARGKSIDAAAVRMRLDDEWRVVDFMPTIGQERYDEGDRVPMRELPARVTRPAAGENRERSE